MISQDIINQRDAYMTLMQELGQAEPATIEIAVAETQAQLLAIFESVREPHAMCHPADGEWSLRDLALHAGFTERLVARLVHYMARGSTPPPETFEGAGIGMIPKDRDRPYGEALAELRAYNDEMIEAIRNLPASRDMEMKLPHPFFGPLNCLEWAGFHRVHDLDHIQHAQKIVSATSS